MEIEYKKKQQPDQERALNFTAFLIPKEDLMLYKLEVSFLPLLIFSRLWDRKQKLLAALSYTIYQSATNSPQIR